MQSDQKKRWMIFSIVVLSIALMVLSVFLTIYIVRNQKMNEQVIVQNSQLESLQKEHSALQSQKQEEASSYENELSQKDANQAAEKEKYESFIAELKRKIDTLLAVDPSHKTVYLTFDDGPSARTPEVLSILRKNNVKATFFVVDGKEYNKYMKNIVDEGHAIGLHTASHDYKKIYSSEDAFLADLSLISDIVYSQTGVRSQIMRFPGGSSNTVSRRYNQGIMSRLSKRVTDIGYAYFDWNICSGDADYPPISAKKIIANCKRIPKKSSAIIVLMHDAADKKATVEALPEVIAYFKSLGLSFGTLTKDVSPVHQTIAN